MSESKTIPKTNQNILQVISNKNDPPIGQRTFYRLKKVLYLLNSTMKFIVNDKTWRDFSSDIVLQPLINGLLLMHRKIPDTIKQHLALNTMNPGYDVVCDKKLVFKFLLQKVSDDILEYLLINVMEVNWDGEHIPSHSSLWKFLTHVIHNITIKVKFLLYYMLKRYECELLDKQMTKVMKVTYLNSVFGTKQYTLNLLPICTFYGKKVSITITPDLSRDYIRSKEVVNINDVLDGQFTYHRLDIPGKVGIRYCIWTNGWEPTTLPYLINAINSVNMRKTVFSDIWFDELSINVLALLRDVDSYDIYEHVYRMNCDEWHCFIHPASIVNMSYSYHGLDYITKCDDDNTNYVEQVSAKFAIPEVRSITMTTAFCDLLVDYMLTIRHFVRYVIMHERQSKFATHKVPFILNSYFVFKIISPVNNIISTTLLKVTEKKNRAILRKLIVGYFTMVYCLMFPSRLIAVNNGKYKSTVAIFHVTYNDKNEPKYDVSDELIWKNIDRITDNIIMDNRDIAASFFQEIDGNNIEMILNKEVEAAMVVDKFKK